MCFLVIFIFHFKWRRVGATIIYGGPSKMYVLIKFKMFTIKFRLSRSQIYWCFNEKKINKFFFLIRISFIFPFNFAYSAICEAIQLLCTVACALCIRLKSGSTLFLFLENCLFSIGTLLSLYHISRAFIVVAFFIYIYCFCVA